jgi:hypothetical protein
MDAQRREEMSDAALDRDLQALLVAEPSAAFVARVRTEIGAEAATSRPWFGASRLVLAVAATIAVAIVTLVGYRGSRRPALADHPAALSTRPLAISHSAAGVGPLVAGLRGGVFDRPEATSHVAPPHAAGVPQQLTQRAVAAPRAVASAEPEVLVDPREAAALRAFFARARSGDVALAAIVAPEATPLPDADDVHDISIAPIAFEPVMGATDTKGVRQ